ncbi:MFS transporter, partial [Streptomyces sp. NPDC057052]|uniref:MFS transporter n=1 Tax=Streptomyces sp. NPDC057052 TaxID=3346010 RepID=UPI00363D67E8
MRLVMTEPVERMTGPYRRRWWALLVLCLSLLIIVMANTALTVAAPAMTDDLGLTSADLQWVIDGYTVPYAALMLLLGAIGDKYSRRGALLLGLVVFAGGAVSGYLADSAGSVIAGRAVMGVGAALIMPATLSLLAATFPRAERAKAITLWTATAGLAIAAGPLVAGALLENHGWSSTFLINVPVAVVAIVGALVLVPPSKAGHHDR